MADPFEVRMRFTSQLQHLNASTSSALKAANYALRHSEFSDDLHSCILEQLEKNNMNNRANIMYFLPALCDTAQAQQQTSYVRMVERDILRIIDLVAPDDGSGAANVKVVRKVLQSLQGKGFLLPQTVGELEECISGRDAGAVTSPTPVAAPAGFAQPIAPVKDTPAMANVAAQGEGISSAMRSTPQSASRDTAGQYHTGIRLDKRQIEQRIEEDRERHKRAREGIWAIPQSATNMLQDLECEKSWDSGGEIDEDDYIMADEEEQERGKHLEFKEY